MAGAAPFLNANVKNYYRDPLVIPEFPHIKQRIPVIPANQGIQTPFGTEVAIEKPLWVKKHESITIRKTN